jgi:uncharacterized protein (TIGR03086 family)
MTVTGPALDPGRIRDECRRANDGFDQVIAAVPSDAWDRPSQCDEWTIADVAGHVVWGQQLLQSLAAGAPRPGPDGAPGAPHSRVIVGADPLAVWRHARDTTLDALTPDALVRVVEVGGPFGSLPFGTFVRFISIVDMLAHTWDIGAAASGDVRLSPDLATEGLAFAKTFELSRGGRGLKPPLDPPPAADAQTQFLAYTGRQAW